MDGLKFDLRLYVLVFGVDPLRLFLYNEGLTRLATAPYEPLSADNVEEVRMHLTNYALNKHARNFVQNQKAELDSVGHKRSLKHALRFLAQRGEDPEKLWASIKDLVVKTLAAGLPSLRHAFRSC